MPLFVQQNVLRLQVSVDDPRLVKSLEPQNNLGGIKSDSVLVKPLLLPEMEKEFTTIKEVHDHVELVLSLEGVVHLHQKRIVNVLQYVSFSLSMVKLIPIDEGDLFEYFHGVVLGLVRGSRCHHVEGLTFLHVLPLLNQKDLSKGASTNHF